MRVSLTGKRHAVQVHLGVGALVGVSLFVIAVVPVEGRVAFVLAHFELTKNIRKKKHTVRTMQQQCNNNATSMQQQCNNNATTTKHLPAFVLMRPMSFFAKLLATCHIVGASKEHRNTNSDNFTIEHQNRKINS